MDVNSTIETINKLRDALSGVDPAVLAKATYQLGGTTTSPLTYYDLEEEAKVTVPVITPLVAMLPRVKGGGGIATHWDEITGLNTANLPMGVPEGKRGAIHDYTAVRRLASYATIGIESSLTEEQDLAAEGQQDMKALQILNLLAVARMGEEAIDLGANATAPLGTTPTPTNTPSNTGGSLTAAASPYHIRCVALTLAAFKRASLIVGIPTTQSYTSGSGQNRTVNAGAAQVSADSTATIASGTTGSAASVVAAVKGAVAYAWFIGTDATTNCRLAGITTTNKFLFTAVPAAITPPAEFAGVVGTNFDTDRSANNLLYDGLITILTRSGSGSYYQSLDETQLATDGAGACTQINTALKTMFDRDKVSPTHMMMGTDVLIDLSILVVKNGGAPIIRLFMDANSATPEALQMTAGQVVGLYMNRTAMGGGQTLKVILHPDMPPGMIIFFSDRLSRPVPGILNPIQIKTQQEWHMIEWPQTEREEVKGLYARQVLQCYFTPAYGMLACIKPGIA